MWGQPEFVSTQLWFARCLVGPPNAGPAPHPTRHEDDLGRLAGREAAGGSQEALSRDRTVNRPLHPVLSKDPRPALPPTDRLVREDDGGGVPSEAKPGRAVGATAEAGSGAGGRRDREASSCLRSTAVPRLLATT